jgi:HEPN domain-containing protein/predicted nucleotidyltransferase
VAIDIEAQVRYWQDGSADDLEAAQTLLNAGKIRQAGFFGHLAVEKALKARIVAVSGDLPPRSHDLLFLINSAKIDPTEAQRDFLGRIQLYCLEGLSDRAASDARTRVGNTRPGTICGDNPMVDQSIEKSVKRYLHAVRQTGIHANRAILFGSRARGTGHIDSDIDLIVIAPEFDLSPDRALVERLWQLRARTDHRIEPIPCGEAEWAAPITARAIIEIAHREGIAIHSPDEIIAGEN